jgi:hypothetical protein
MPDSDLQSRIQLSPQVPSERVERKEDDSGQSALPGLQRDALSQVSCRAGDASCAGAHAGVLNRATDSQPARGRQALMRLQRQYGNRFVQRVMDLARKGDGEADAAPEVEAGIRRAQGGGQALDGGVRAQMEPAMGADFSGVRVHTGPQAHDLNQAVSARAFTTGQDIFFRQGEYRPGTSSGRELLAHELTHVVQQTGGGEGPQAKLTVGAAGDQYEQEADRVAGQVMRQEAEGIQRQALQRQVEEDKDKAKMQAQLQRQAEEDKDKDKDKM